MKLRAPSGPLPSEVLAECNRSIATSAAAAVSALATFQAAWAELRKLEKHTVGGAAAEPFTTIAAAIDLLSLRAQLARLELEGKTTMQQRGRPGAPARGRVASRYANGWTDRETGRTWRPTARDLALLGICEGATVLPDGWQTMTLARLIGEEARAMRCYLPKAGKK